MLWQLEQPQGATIYLPSGRFTLGRDEGCDLPVDQDGVSRRHARLNCAADRLVVRDLQSTNGVFVNGELIDGPTELHDGDRVSFGQEAEFEVAALDVPADGPVLVVTQSDLGHWCLAPGQYVIGRDDSADLAIAHPDLSRRHCTLHYDGHSVEVVDEGSTNGVFVDSERVQRQSVPLPGQIELGPVAVYLSIASPHGQESRAATPVRPSQPTAPARPAAHDGMPVAGWLFMAMVVLLLVSGGIWLYLDQPSSRDRERVVEKREPVTPAEEVRARHTVSRIASDKALRGRVQKLVRKTRELRDAWRPVADLLDRSAGGLQRVTGSAFTRRLLAGTDLATLASALNSLSGNTRRLVDDLTGMPEDLNALERGLKRYQANPTRENLRALSEPAGKTIAQGERIEGLVRLVSSSVGGVQSRLQSLARKAAGWPMGGGLADSARQSARILQNSKGMLDEYRTALVRDLSEIRKLQRETRQVNSR